MQPETLTINANSLTPGFFTCQYFGVTGDLLPPGTSTPSTTVAPTTSVVTTRGVPTTTKGASCTPIIELFALMIVYVLVL